MNYAFLESLNEILEEVFDILDSRYLEEMAVEVQKRLEDAIKQNYEIRYLLIEGETGQLESRRHYETREEAEAAAKTLGTEKSLIGVLLIEG